MFEEWITEHNLVHDNFIFFPIQLYKKATTEEEKQAMKNRHTRYQGYAEHFRNIFDKYFNQNISPYDSAYRVTVYTIEKNSCNKSL